MATIEERKSPLNETTYSHEAIEALREAEVLLGEILVRRAEEIARQRTGLPSPVPVGVESEDVTEGLNQMFAALSESHPAGADAGSYID